MSSGHSSKESGSVLGVDELTEASTPVFSFLGFLLFLIFLAVPSINDAIVEDHLEASGGGGGQH